MPKEVWLQQAIPGAVSISLDAEGEYSPFYAEGIVYYRNVTNNGYSGDLDLLTIGLVLDIWTEKGNDNVKYKKVAGQEEFDKF